MKMCSCWSALGSVYLLKRFFSSLWSFFEAIPTSRCEFNCTKILDYYQNLRLTLQEKFNIPLQGEGSDPLRLVLHLKVVNSSPLSSDVNWANGCSQSLRASSVFHSLVARLSHSSSSKTVLKALLTTSKRSIIR